MTLGRGVRGAGRRLRRAVAAIGRIRRRMGVRRPPVAPPPGSGPAVWVIAGESVRQLLAAEWHQQAPRPGSWRMRLDAAAPTLVLVEVADGAAVGWDGSPSELTDLLDTAVVAGIPTLLWDTGTGGTLGPAPRALTACFVTEAARAALWRDRYPGIPVEVLPPAVAVWAVPPGRPSRMRAAAALTTDPPARWSRDLPVDRWRGAPDSQAVAGYRVCVTGQVQAALVAATAGTPVVWTGAAEGLPADLRSVVTIEDDVRAAVRGRVLQPELGDREGLAIHRAVLRSHSGSERAAALLRAAGVTTAPAVGISAVVPTNRVGQLENVLANVARQSHDSVQVVLVLHGLSVPEAELRGRARDHGVDELVVVRAGAELTLGACLNLGVDAADGTLVAKLDDDNHYGPHYLGDLAAAFRYTDAGIVGKWAHYVWLRSTGAVVLRYPEAEHAYGRRVQGGAMLLDGEVVRSLRFSDIPRAVDTDILDRALTAGVRIYGADRFNFVSVRGSDRTTHTWPVTDATFLTGAGQVLFYGDPRQHVDV